MKIYKSKCIVYHPDCIKEQLGEVETIKELNEFVHSVQEAPYYRVMPAINEPDADGMNGLMIDYGSYTDFLYVDGITFDYYTREDYKYEA